MASLTELRLGGKPVYGCRRVYRTEGEQTPSTCLAHAMGAGAELLPGPSKLPAKAPAKS